MDLCETIARFIPLQDDELIESLHFLSAELKSPNDNPKAIIAFQEQLSHVIRFKVILLRVSLATQCSPCLQQLSKKLPRDMQFIHERAAPIGQLQEIYTKEAHVFTLEVNDQLFLRTNHSVDLVKAREFVLNSLGDMIGPFCDLTGRVPSSQIIPHQLDQMQEKRQTLSLHLPRATHSLDPRIGVDRTSGIVITMLFEGLFRINAAGQPEPAIAQKVEISDDQRKYLFTLRPSTWSNGSSLTAHDFAYAWKKILEPDCLSLYAFLFFSIKNAEAVKRGEKPMQYIGIQVIDDLTLSIELERPTPHFLELTSHWMFYPLSWEIDQKHPGWAYQNDRSHVSNGPFKLEEWKLNDDLKLVKNSLYWDQSNVFLDQVDISIIDDEKKAIDLFHQGKLDWVGDPLSKISPLEIPKLQNKQLLVSDSNHFGLYWLQLNLTTPYFKQAQMRKAFAMGTQRQPLIDHILKSQDIPSFSFNHQIIPPSFHEDLEQAKILFNEGLEAMGMSLKELPPLVISHSEIEEQEALAFALGAQWSQLFGIEVTYQKKLWNTYFNDLNKGNFMIGGIVWYHRFNDPSYLYNLLISKEYVVNVTTWKNATYQQLIEDAQKGLNPTHKEMALAECEKILAAMMPVIPLFYQKFRFIKNRRLKGYILSNTSQIDFRHAYLEKETSL